MIYNMFFDTLTRNVRFQIGKKITGTTERAARKYYWMLVDRGIRANVYWDGNKI